LQREVAWKRANGCKTNTGGPGPKSKLLETIKASLAAFGRNVGCCQPTNLNQPLAAMKKTIWEGARALLNASAIGLEGSRLAKIFSGVLTNSE